jgi:NAD+ kinase
VKAVDIVLNTEKEGAVRLARELAQWLQQRGVLVMVEHSGAEAMGTPSLSRDEKDLVNADFAIVMGGDGTLLRASHMLSRAGVPMLPVSFGQFGFLTDVEPANALPAVEKALEGDYRLDERMMLRGHVFRDNLKIHSSDALNDMVIAKGPLSRMLRLAISVSGRSISTLPADGLIVATPTGSTAYSLSAGGPLVTPELKVIIITPICPHTLNARSIVVSSKETVEVNVESGPEEVVMLTVDGQSGMPLQPGDRVSVGEADFKVKLIALREPTFFEKLQTRLRWGDRFDA